MNSILVKYRENKKKLLLNFRVCAYWKEETARFQGRVKNFVRPG
jgi:hypothetical protein